MSILERFPERTAHVRRLKSLLSNEGPCVPNLVVWGRHHGGKASIVKAVLEELRRPYAWITCCLTDSVENVVATIVRRLLPPSVTDAPSRRLLSAIRFIQYLPELCPKDGPLHHLVLENPECLSSPVLLQLLMKVEEDPEIHLSVIFLAHSAKDWIPKGSSMAPLSVSFEGYTVEEMTSMMEKRFLPFNTYDNISRDFFKSVLPTLMRCTAEVSILQSCLRYLFDKFWEPIPQNTDEPLNVQELNRHVMPHVSSVLRCLNQGHISDIEHVLREMDGKKKNHPVADAGLHSTGLPVYKQDRILFDPSQGTKRRKVQSTCDTIHEKKRGTPLAFDYERHFMVAQRLMQDVDATEDLAAMYSTLYASQFATLEAFSFIKRVTGDPLKGAKYVCSVDHEFATKLAEGLKLNLPDYLDT